MIKLLLKIFLILFISQPFLLCPISIQSQNDSTNIKNDIIIIKLKNGEEVRGILINEDDFNFTILSGKNNTVVIEKIRIESFEILKSEEIKNKRESLEDALNYSQNCFFPTAYITEDNKLFFNSHYDATYNLKAGINKNFELTAGGVAIAYNYIGITYSAELFDFLQFGTTVFGTYLMPSDVSEDQFGTIVIPRLSIGNKNRNITIGLIGASIENFNNWIYGGYFGAQRRIYERWTIAGELATINLDSYNFFYLGNVTAKFKRRETINWKFGIVGIKFPGLNALFPNDIPFIPIPYFGYSRLF